MKKHLLLAISITSGLTVACSSGPKVDSHKMNCEKMHTDSQAKLAELQSIFTAYQNINFDLATKLSQPFKDEVLDLDGRVRKQKHRCWKEEERPIDSEMASLKEDVVKIYGNDDFKPKKKIPRAVASVVQPQLVQEPPPQAVEQAPAIETPAQMESASEE